MRIRMHVFVLSTVSLAATGTAAQWPEGLWTSEGERGRIEIYPCGAAGHEISNQPMMDKLCSYVKSGGARLCGGIVQVLPNGEAELKAKGKTVNDELRKPMLCIAPSGDTVWPWKGGVFNPDDEDTYWLKVAPQGGDKLNGSGCGAFGFICPAKGEFAWTKAK